VKVRALTGRGDAEKMSALLSVFAAQGLVLPRTADEILEKADSFLVAERAGEFVGCVAVRDFHEKLFEIRSLAVIPEFQSKGLGSTLIHKAMGLIPNQGGEHIFALTYRPGLFRRCGFRVVDKQMFPEKIWSDCVNCKKYSCCDETAVLLER